MANSSKKIVRRVKASTGDNKPAASAATVADKPTVVKTTPKTTAAKAAQPATNKHVAKQVAKPGKSPKRVTDHVDSEPLAIVKPFIAMGHYFRDSWHELRQVQWPNRRATWKMTLGVVIFCAIVGAIVLVADWASQWIIQEVIL